MRGAMQLSKPYLLFLGAGMGVVGGMLPRATNAGSFLRTL